jgi:hypothetical protein
MPCPGMDETSDNLIGRYTQDERADFNEVTSFLLVKLLMEFIYHYIMFIKVMKRFLEIISLAARSLPHERSLSDVNVDVADGIERAQNKSFGFQKIGNVTGKHERTLQKKP